MDSMVIKQINKALCENQEMDQTVLDNAFDAIISMDGLGAIKNCYIIK